MIVYFYQRNGLPFYASKIVPIQSSECRYHWGVWLIFRRDFVEGLITGTDDRTVEDIAICGDEG